MYNVCSSDNVCQACAEVLSIYCPNNINHYTHASVFQYAFEISLQTSGDSLHCECLLRLVFRLFHKLYVIMLI